MDHAEPIAPIAGPGFDLERDAWGRLVLIDERGRHVGVDPVRSFPISEPGRWISLCDAEGHELAYLESLDAVSPELRKLLLDELARREFLPVIRRILRIDSGTIPESWDVETDRGPIRFSLEGEENARRIGPHRALIVDSRGIRFHIPDIRKLDVTSRRILERYL